MSSAGLKKEEARTSRSASGSGSWLDSERRETERRSSPPHSNDHAKREERPKREYNSTHSSDDRSSVASYKRPKTEAPSPSSSHTSPTSSQPSPPPPPPAPKESINLGLSGKLAAHANTTTGGSILKYQPPADAAQPTLSYRLYCFPSSSTASTSGPPLSPQPPLYIHSQSLYRIGRDPLVNDLVISHHSVSKQHAVLQYRRPAHTAAGSSGGGGGGGGGVRLYVLDVGSVNGTVLNGERVEVARFVEVRERDVLVFGQCGREYVLLHGDSRPMGGGGGEERKEAVSGGGGKKDGGEKKRPAWADDDDDDV